MTGPARRDRSKEIRAQLKPLGPHERPTAVTVAAIVAAALALANILAFAAGLKIGGEEPNVIQVAIPAVLMLVAAVGMWRALYWAVLGFQALLGVLIIYLAILVTIASNWQTVGLVVVLEVPAVILFWKLVRAMARIQMPKYP